MPVKQLATWIPKTKQWQMMIRGNRHKRSCRQLGLPPGSWTKEKSRQAANDYFEKWQASHILDNTSLRDGTQQRIKNLERKIKWAAENNHSTDALNERKQSVIANPENPELWLEEDLDESIAIANLFGITVPDGLNHMIAETFFGERKVWQERLKNAQPVEDEFTLLKQAEKFLTLEKQRIIKDKTYVDLHNWIMKMVNAGGVLSPDMDTRKIDKQTVDDSYLWCRQFKTGSKVWGYFRRLMTHLIERDCCEMPSNLHSKQFRFGSKKKRIKTYSKKQVIDCLSELKPRFRLYALLAFNTSMLSVDIANLTWADDHDSLCWLDAKKKTITRKRVKTEGQESSPVVTYPLWKEVFNLLMEHKSDHEKYVLTSKTNTKLVTSRKNLISRQWSTRKPKPPIQLKEFRSIGASRLKTKKEYRSLIEIYLANVPSNVSDSNYADVPQRAINGMIKWLGRQYDIR